MRKIIYIFLGTAIALISLTACQTTPDKPVVVSKEQETMIERARKENTKTVAEQVSAPRTYSAEVSAANGKLTVAAQNAPIELPVVDSMPLLRVNAADFSQVQVDEFIRALFPGQTIYEMQSGQTTKDEIEEQILDLKKLKASEKYAAQDVQKQLDDSISRLEELYEKAPETSEDIIVESDGQLKQAEKADSDTGEQIAYYTALSVTTNYKDYSQAAMFGVQNNSDLEEIYSYNGSCYYSPERNAMLGYDRPGDTYDSNFGQHPPILIDKDTVIDDAEVREKLHTTPAQAKALVEQMLERVDISDMTVVAMYLTDDENLGNVDGIVSPAEHYAYKLYLSRTINGIPIAYIAGVSSAGNIEEALEGSESGDAMAFSGSWAYETIEAMVDDSGILSFYWHSPLEISNTLVENATLLPFSEIQSVFENMMQVIYEARANDDEVEYITFSVDRVSLELQRIAEQNSIENGLLVPVWNFYGTCTSKDVDGEERWMTYLSGDGVYATLMTINAVDGSFIDWEKGY